jgi:hypothetical protein
MWEFILGTYPYTKLQSDLITLSFVLGAIAAFALSRLVESQYPGLPLSKKLPAILVILVLGELVYLSALYNFT